MRRVFAVLLVALLAAGCGVRPSGVIPGLEAPSGPEESSGPQLYFLLGGQLFPIPHDIIEDPVAMLAAGPNQKEKAQGLTSQVPKAAAPATVIRDGPAVTVLLATDVGALTPLAVDQIVCTVLTQRPRLAAPGQDDPGIVLRGGGHMVAQRTCPAGR